MILNFAEFILYIRCPPHYYIPIFDVLNIENLAIQSYSLKIEYLNGLLSEKIDSSYLLNLNNFRVPQRNTKCTMPFHTLPRVFNYEYLANEPIIGLSICIQISKLVLVTSYNSL